MFNEFNAHGYKNNPHYLVIVTASSQLAFFVISIDYFVPLNPAELRQYSNTCILTPIEKDDKKMSDNLHSTFKCLCQWIIGFNVSSVVSPSSIILPVLCLSCPEEILSSMEEDLPVSYYYVEQRNWQQLLRPPL